MSAIKFIKDHGIEKAREVVEGAPCNAIYYWQIPRCKHGVYSTHEQNQGRAIVLAQLRGLVDSISCVESLGGIERIKYLLDVMKKMSPKETSTVKFVKKAIADYEQLFGNTETLELETLRDCDTSPNCKKFDERVNHDNKT